MIHLFKISTRALMDTAWPGLALLAAFLSILISFASVAHAQGWWWGTPIDPSFDQNTVVKLTGRATRVTIVSMGAPSTLQLETAGEVLKVILGPGWYLTELGADIRDGDTLSIDGSKIKDRQGQVYLLAARVTNQRTHATFELRDESGRPKWRGHKQSRSRRG